MGMFGNMAVRPVPYYPTPEEQAMTIPGQPASSTPSPMPIGMFGSGLRQMMTQPAPIQAGQGGGMTVNPASAGAGPAEPQHYAPSVALNAGLPAQPIDLSGIAAAPDLSNAKPRRPGFNEIGGLGDTIRAIAADLMRMGGNNEGASAIEQGFQQRQAAAFQARKLNRAGFVGGSNS